jgi:predicted nucleotidyltransferase
MDVARPYAALIPGARGQVLASLVQLERQVTVRALARHAGVSPQGALSVVNELNEAGLVLVEQAGRALLVSLNRDHLSAEPLVSLVMLRGRLIERLRAVLATWPSLAGAWLFGSAARADGGSDSDIDLLLVAESDLDDAEWAAATADLRARVGAWTGNPVQVVEHTSKTFGQLVKRRNPLIAALRADGIALTDHSRELLRGVA